MAKRPFQPGDRVQLTGSFLRSTGQLLGSEGQSKWIVIACACSLCKTGSFVATDQKRFDGEGQRHINRGNLKRYGKPSVLDDHVSPEMRALLFADGDTHE